MEKKHLYGDYVRNLHQSVVRRLEIIESEYNFEKGAEFEIAICEILRSFLPQKYGICRGFVIDRDGKTAGDDIIIFDQDRFPTIRSISKGSYELKEKIPIEAVYAYIEAKNTLKITQNPKTCVLTKGITQCINFKKICNRRHPVVHHELDPYVKQGGVISTFPDYLPKRRNPAFAVLIGRNVQIGNKKELSTQEIHEALKNFEMDDNENNPDLIIAGSHNFCTPHFYSGADQVRSLFYLDHHHERGYWAGQQNDLTYGIFLSQLAFVVDWIRLGRMPWIDIITEATFKEYRPLGY
ncbi:DUF6602 domain-containing protein [Dyadobacter luticola]|uniref:DUF6602 domain-containing protein n=1 Tax=Dyadobacter luticola TaxID=1979387 RepID=A0A5R9KVQ8_9BACT|nr:DUF6602 domain-containing protein [Dyadobacter luticola]TLV00353.1 hypothetical protein FEN17_12720 [Dyadobacter luticola]